MMSLEILEVFSANHFNVKNQIESMFATICNTYCIIRIIQSKIQMIYFMNLQKKTYNSASIARLTTDKSVVFF